MLKLNNRLLRMAKVNLQILVPDLFQNLSEFQQKGGAIAKYHFPESCLEEDSPRTVTVTT